MVPRAATTKRATRKRVPWPGVFFWFSGPVGIPLDGPCAMGAHVALSPAGDCVSHLPWELAISIVAGGDNDGCIFGPFGAMSGNSGPASLHEAPSRSPCCCHG